MVAHGAADHGQMRVRLKSSGDEASAVCEHNLRQETAGEESQHSTCKQRASENFLKHSNVYKSAK